MESRISMKKILGCITIMFAIFFFALGQFKVQAQEITKLEARISGPIEVGKEIEISIYTNNIKNLYTGDIQFKIDSSILQITAIEKGSLLTKDGVTNFEQKSLPGDNESPKDLARYIFSAVGENDGYSGEGTIVVFKAKVLKNANLSIKAKAFEESLSNNYNMKIDLVSSDIEYMNYEFIPYGKGSPEVPPSPNGNDAGKDKPGTQQPVDSKGGSSGDSSKGDNGSTAPSEGQNPSEKPQEGKDNNSSEESEKEQSPANNEADNNTDKDPAENSKDNAKEAIGSESQQENSEASSPWKIIVMVIASVLILGAAGALWYFKLRPRGSK